jgi:CRP-like cAMP-binding protein
MLLDHCWRVFGREVTGQHERHSAWAVQRIRLEIAYIFRDHFRERADVKEQLREALKQGQSAEVVALVLVEPNDSLVHSDGLGPAQQGSGQGLAATFPDLSELEKTFACRALFDQCAERLAAGGRPMLPYLL